MAWRFLPSAPGVGDDVIPAVPVLALVHIWSVPVEYLTRKYQLVRLVTNYLNQTSAVTHCRFFGFRETYFIYMIGPPMEQ